MSTGCPKVFRHPKLHGEWGAGLRLGHKGKKQTATYKMGASFPTVLTIFIIGVICRADNINIQMTTTFDPQKFPPTSYSQICILSPI